jgi:hypothetical protein
MHRPHLSQINRAAHLLARPVDELSTMKADTDIPHATPERGSVFDSSSLSPEPLSLGLG